MRSNAAARRYARALFAIAREASTIEEVSQELRELSELLDASPALANSLFRPLHPVRERRALLDAICERIGSSRPVRNFYSFLVDQRRLVEFPTIYGEFGRLADAAAGRTRATLVTASPLSGSQRERLKRALSNRTGQEVELDVSVDAELLGGAIANVGGLVFDGSLRTQLSQLRVSLMRGN